MTKKKDSWDLLMYSPVMWVEGFVRRDHVCRECGEVILVGSHVWFYGFFSVFHVSCLPLRVREFLDVSLEVRRVSQ